MRHNGFSTILGTLAASTLYLSAAHAQTVTGAVTGLVSDATGAVIPGAQVVAHNVDTGVDSRATTDSAGLYRIPFLPIGRYSVMVTAQGFGAQTVPPFQLEALQTPTFNLKLQPGGASETVTVSDAAPILDTSDATLSGTFTANTIQNFPLNGLDFSALTLYVPGSVSSVGTSGTTSIERSTYYTDSVNLNGNRAQANNYTLDGIDLNETFNNVIAYSPAPESLQEVKVLTANSPADYGNVNGGGVVSILKSGTNQFHGSAYGYVQDYRFNANSYANGQTHTATQPFSQAQFGGTFGGPIKRDKLFFFVDYLGSRHHNGGIAFASVLTQDMRNGNFSALLPNKTFLYDSQNNFAPYAGDAGLPILNPVAKFLFANPSLYPLPNATPTDGIIANNLSGTQKSFQANNQGDVKIEFDPHSADKVTGFFSISTGYDGKTSLLPITFPGANVFPTHVAGATWVHIFSPQVINQARVGFTRVKWVEGLPVDGTGQFGTAGDAKVGIAFPNQAYQGFTYQDIGGLLTGGGFAPSGVGNPALINNGLIDNTYSYIDDITLQRGKQTLRFGVEALRYENNYPTTNANGYLGSLHYNGEFTSDGSGGGGYGAADFVLDRVSGAGATLANNNVGQRQWRAAAYVSDDLKATGKLTLNAGVRYEYDQPWYEQNNKTGNIDIATGQPIYAGSVPALAPANSGVCSNRACYDANYRQIMPRLGFAYQVNDRLVIRGGYGATSFFEGNSSNQRLTSIAPFIEAVNASTTAPSAAAKGSPNKPGTPRTAEEGFAQSATQGSGSINIYPQNIQPAYIQEYSLTTEYALTRSTSLQVGFVGEQGQHIEDYGNINQYLVNGDQTSAPYYNNQYLGVNAPSILSQGSAGILITESRASMNYSALQAVLRQRASHGLEFTFNYTYGKALTNSAGNYPVNTAGANNYGQGAFQNYYDSGADWGPAGYDVRHNISFTGVYALPVGRGKQSFSNIPLWLDEVIGGWKISSAGVAYTGFPETIEGSSNNSNSDGNARPDQLRPLKIVNRSLSHWYGTDPSTIPCTPDPTTGILTDNGVCAFATPRSNGAGGTLFGDARVGNTRGPGYVNVDMSAFKDFHTFREQTLGFRFDAFNAFNIVSYGNPDTGFTDGNNFGNVATEAVRSVERHLQFSANYRF